MLPDKRGVSTQHSLTDLFGCNLIRFRGDLETMMGGGQDPVGPGNPSRVGYADTQYMYSSYHLKFPLQSIACATFVVETVNKCVRIRFRTGWAPS